MNFYKNVLMFAACLLYFSVTCYGSNFIDDYCWRDYDGIMPNDALKAGMDRSGKPIYIGQTLFENKLIPGKVHQDSNEIHIEFHTAHTLNETIKILCTECPEKFEWFKTRYDEILQIQKKQIFEGGYEKNFITYVGRALSHGEMTVGKVICFKDGCYKLTTIEEGKWYDHTEFEILTYNPDAVCENNPSANSNNDKGANNDNKPFHSDAPTKPSVVSYCLLALVLVALIALVVVIVRRC